DIPEPAAALGWRHPSKRWRASSVSDTELTPPASPKFDFATFPTDTLFFDRRSGIDRRDLAPTAPVPEEALATTPGRRRKDRRRRIDPTTFDKQYTPAEIEFMTAMQQFKVHTCKPFPSHREVLKVVVGLGYRKLIDPEIN
ncbi:MAG TPA: hypothetical protein VGZ22_19080, partial [Isosphaeraceae bacterium]|nr:hypothetical protein [Isosphaeraceae bacterium]